MKQSFTRVLILFLSFLAFGLLFPRNVSADNDSLGVTCDVTVNGTAMSTSTGSAPLLFGSSRNGQDITYPVQVCGDLSLLGTLPSGVNPIISFAVYSYAFNVPNQGRVNLTRSGSCLTGEFTTRVDQGGGAIASVFDVEGDNATFTPVCRRVFAQLAPTTLEEAQQWEQAKSSICSSVSIDPANPIHNDDVSVNVVVPERFWSNLLFSPEGYTYTLRYTLKRLTDGQVVQDTAFGDIGSGGLADPSRHFNHAALEAGSYQVLIYLNNDNSQGDQNLCTTNFTVGTPQNPGGISDETVGDGVFNVCTQTGPAGSAAFQECENCFRQNQGVWTGIGCIPFNDPAETIRAFITVGLGISGGVVVLMSLAGAFLLSTSQGEPKRVDEAKSLITSAVAGILFIIFSVTILRFIGVNILQLPAFG